MTYGYLHSYPTSVQYEMEEKSIWRQKWYGKQQCLTTGHRKKVGARLPALPAQWAPSTVTCASVWHNTAEKLGTLKENIAREWINLIHRRKCGREIVNKVGAQRPPSTHPATSTDVINSKQKETPETLHDGIIYSQHCIIKLVQL